MGDPVLRGQIKPYLAIVQHIRQTIQAGCLRLGDRIPSIQRLAEEHGVAYVTAARAIRKLVDEGVLESRVGIGTFVVHQPKPLKVALVIQRHYDYPVITHPLLGRLCEGFFQSTNARGYARDLRVYDKERANPVETDFARSLIRDSFDGALVDATQGRHASLLKKLAAKMPVMALGTAPGCAGVDFVAQDQFDHMLKIIEHLQAQGTRRIIFCRFFDADLEEIHSERAFAFLTMSKAKGCISEILTGNSDECAMVIASRRKKLDAVVCTADPCAAEIREKLHAYGIEIPRDLLMVGHDDWERSTVGTPFFTTIDPDYEGMAARALEILSERTLGSAPDPPVREYHAGRLVVRQSSRRTAEGGER